MTRSKIREQIFKILFRVEFTEAQEFAEQLEMGLSDIADVHTLSEDEATYIKGKVEDIIEKLPEIDELLTTYAEGWKLSRIGKAELAILRLAVYELKYDEDIPPKVAINEAVELTKTFCAEDAKGFVNGILGRIERA